MTVTDDRISTNISRYVEQQALAMPLVMLIHEDDAVETADSGVATVGGNISRYVQQQELAMPLVMLIHEDDAI
ncbi:hypothetical protein SAMN05660748_0536 [Blastococcus aggregatus]|uniref:Uncharacterized protein n=1 Tax=Blastococcus aggregatus TaxID=38502 RepID=A0A285V363_9ACTN|nr:hypothetical protein [Blastococcus aggregatus]SOC46941.1 hypothetical protein SAMN05660748_0536 [Blastococcus aggregatus]